MGLSVVKPEGCRKKQFKKKEEASGNEIKKIFFAEILVLSCLRFCINKSCWVLSANNKILGRQQNGTKI